MVNTKNMTSTPNLPEIAKKMRILILKMITEAKSGHPGGSLSCTDLVAALYFSQMNYRAQEPHWNERDRFILSKGHGVPAVYAAMAMAGFFPEEELWTLRKTGSRLQGHPDPERLPGIEAPTGSLGQGLSIAQGMALASRLSEKPWHTYCLLGDGELQEGQVWEAAMSIPRFRLGSLTAIVDYNGGQIDGPVNEVMPLEPLADKWTAFGWKVTTINGHDFDEIIQAFTEAKREKPESGTPHMIIAKTIKGKGVSFMENKIEWHGAAPKQEQLTQALAEISGSTQ